MKRTTNTWRLLTIIVGAVVMALALIGCRTKKEIITKVVETHDTLYYERSYVDTLIHIEADTAQARLLVECDESNNALVSVIDNLTGDKTSLESLVRYYETKDAETGEKHRKAVVDIMAVVQAQDEEIQILQEKLAAASKSSTDEHQESERSQSWKSLLAAFLMGMSLAFIISITIKEWK